MDQSSSDVKSQRVQELQAAFVEEAPWGASVMFLDSINTITEFESLLPHLMKSLEADVIEYYRENLTRWQEPQLPPGFQEKCPRLAARLDTPQKVRILLRGAYFRGVTPLLMGEVLEDIIYRHEVRGEKKVVYSRYRGDQKCDALRIVYHSEIPGWTLTNLALPGRTIVGCSSTEGLYIDWRTKEERKAAGED